MYLVALTLTQCRSLPIWQAMLAHANPAGPTTAPRHASQCLLLLQVTQGRDAKALKDALANQGIMVRHYAKKELSGYIRVSVGKPEQTDALMAVLSKL